MRVYTSLWFSLLLFLHLFLPLDGKRGGMSMGRTGGSRGSSASRSGSGGGGGLFGSKSRPAPAATNYQRNTNLGGQGSGGWGSGSSSSGSSWGEPAGSGGGWNNKPRTSSGLFGGGGHRPHRYSKGSGIGSMVRSNTFKNAIVGAAAGYLTYQAGKHIIRSMAGPMMWGNRNYYWGSNYYQPRVGQNQMCRMPIDSSDTQFGNDQSRPREIVWGCGHYEYCCGYECCRGGSASHYGYGSSVGMIIFTLVVLCCLLPLAMKYCKALRNRQRN